MAENKVALVTGASSGLGREFALSLARSGFLLVVAARRVQLLESLCQEIGHLKARAVELDVSASEKIVETSVENAWQCFGAIHVLVNNAGVRGNVHSPLTLEEEDWNKVMNTNARGTWLVSKAVGKRMAKNKLGGSIINVSSTAGLDRGVLPGGLAYAASKAAINQMTKVMALELGKFNIRVNAIAAGIFPSEITGSLLEKGWAHEAAGRIVPLRRFGNTNPDLTELVVLLASESSDYVTGGIFVVDGGQSLAGIPLWSSL